MTPDASIPQSALDILNFHRWQFARTNFGSAKRTDVDALTRCQKSKIELPKILLCAPIMNFRRQLTLFVWNFAARHKCILLWTTQPKPLMRITSLHWRFNASSTPFYMFTSSFLALLLRLSRCLGRSTVHQASVKTAQSNAYLPRCCSFVRSHTAGGPGSIRCKQVYSTPNFLDCCFLCWCVRCQCAI